MNRAHLIPLVVVGLWLVATSVAGLSVDVDHLCKKRAVSTCYKDYSPCSCTDENVVCDQVSVKTIKSVFNAMTWHDLNSVKIILSPTETEEIPDDLLGYARVTSNINVNCIENSYLRAATNVFRSSEESVLSVTIDGCDLEQFDFTFMRSMTKLQNIFVFRSLNFKSFSGLPYNKNLKLIGIMESSQFLALDQYLADPPALESLYLNGNQLDDNEAATLLKTLASNSVDTLKEVRLDSNRLTRIPDILLSLSNLNELSLKNNEITLLSTNSLAFKGPISITLNGNNIKNIRPGAFGSLKSMGTFVAIRLNLNKFNRMDSNVFQTVLEGMALAGEGSLELGETPIQCDCSLAWLMRDSRSLLKHVQYGKCLEDSTDFADVTVDRFSHCPIA